LPLGQRYKAGPLSDALGAAQTVPRPRPRPLQSASDDA
jgi:hypothetical protein